MNGFNTNYFNRGHIKSITNAIQHIVENTTKEPIDIVEANLEPPTIQHIGENKYMSLSSTVTKLMNEARALNPKQSAQQDRVLPEVTRQPDRVLPEVTRKPDRVLPEVTRQTDFGPTTITGSGTPSDPNGLYFGSQDKGPNPNKGKPMTHDEAIEAIDLAQFRRPGGVNPAKEAKDAAAKATAKTAAEEARTSSKAPETRYDSYYWETNGKKTPAAAPIGKSQIGENKYMSLSSTVTKIMNEARALNPRQIANRDAQLARENMTPEQRRAGVVAANAKRKDLSDRAETRIMAGLPNDAARTARTAEKAKTGAWRVDGAGKRIDPSSYAETDAAKRAANPIPANSSNSNQRKEYDASRSPGYVGYQAGINKRSEDLMASVNTIIDNRNFSKETADYGAEVKRNRESGSTKRIDLSDKGNYPLINKSDSKINADQESTNQKNRAATEVADYEASDEGKKEAEMYKRVNTAINNGTIKVGK